MYDGATNTPTLLYHLNHGNHRDACTEQEVKKKMDANCTVKIKDVKLFEGVYTITLSVVALKDIEEGDEITWNYRDQSNVRRLIIQTIYSLHLYENF